MDDSHGGDVTAMLRAWHAGDQEAYRQVSALLYEELRRRAGRIMRKGQPGGALQTTALVHEAFIRLTGATTVDWQDRQHFLAVAARTMRHVLVDLARETVATKRGGGVKPLTMDSDVAFGDPSVIDLIALDEALERLDRIDPRKVRVVELRFFGGLTVEETAAALDVAPDTVARDWRMARTWLRRALDTGHGR
jgi:RNA polymerase sigma factor (TIGR02999 family)